MSKRKKLEITADRHDGAVFRSSKYDSYAGFGRFDLLKDYFYANPIWTSTRLAKCGKCYDLVSSLPRFPRGQRSKRRIGRKNIRPLFDGTQIGSPVAESQSHGHIHKLSPQNMRCKREAEPNDYNFFSKRMSLRQSINQRHKVMGTWQWGKLDTGKFEVYLENMWRSFTKEKKNAFTYLDSLWFSLYSEGSSKEKVLSWIKKKDIFSKKYVFVPIVQWGHWFLLILCNFGGSPEAETKGRCMLLLDSLKEANAKHLEPGIRRFVFDIFNAEERPENKKSVNKIPLRIPQVPQQKSDSECGFYVLYYIYLCVELLENFSFSMGYPHFMNELWFGPEEVECFATKLESM